MHLRARDIIYLLIGKKTVTRKFREENENPVKTGFANCVLSVSKNRFLTRPFKISAFFKNKVKKFQRFLSEPIVKIFFLARHVWSNFWLFYFFQCIPTILQNRIHHHFRTNKCHFRPNIPNVNKTKSLLITILFLDLCWPSHCW